MPKPRNDLDTHRSSEACVRALTGFLHYSHDLGRLGGAVILHEITRLPPALYGTELGCCSVTRPTGCPTMRPPEVINAGEVVLKRWEPAWADEAATAVRESLPELEPFVPWARDACDVETSRTAIERSMANWDKGASFNYGIFTGTGDLAGGIDLMTRMGPGVLELGYWMRTAYTGRGYMTAAIEALARVALTMPGIERVAIRHDVANAASAAVAAKAGFAKAGRIESEPESPGDTGTDVLRERHAGR